MDEDDFVSGAAQNYRRRRERGGIKGHWIVFILVAVFAGTLWGGVLLRQNLPPLPFLQKHDRESHGDEPSVLEEGVRLD